MHTICYVTISSNSFIIFSAFVSDERTKFPNLNDEVVNAMIEKEFPSWFEKYVCLLYFNNSYNEHNVY